MPRLFAVMLALETLTEIVCPLTDIMYLLCSRVSNRYIKRRMKVLKKKKKKRKHASLEEDTFVHIVMQNNFSNNEYI